MNSKGEDSPPKKIEVVFSSSLSSLSSLWLLFLKYEVGDLHGVGGLIDLIFIMDGFGCMSGPPDTLFPKWLWS